MPLPEDDREIPVYACCSVGKRQWLWVAWDTPDDAQGGATAGAWGYAATADAAESRAIEWSGPRARPIPAKWASAYRRRIAADARKGREAKGIKPPPKAGSNATPREFLYCAHEADPREAPGHFVVVRHRVVKKTAGKIHVDSEPLRDDPGEDGREPSAPDRAHRTIAIDRATLKREGRYRHPRSHREMFFYATERDAIRDVETVLEALPTWCTILGIRLPCSADAVKSAYRRLAKESHPDRGGDPAHFLALEQAYRDGLAYCNRAIAAS